MVERMGAKSAQENHIYDLNFRDRKIGESHRLV